MRLRAQVLRLSGRGESIKGISSYTGRSEASISRDLDRWEDRRFEGLADGSAPGNPPRVTEEAKEFLKERLSRRRGPGTRPSWPRLCWVASGFR